MKLIHRGRIGLAAALSATAGGGALDRHVWSGSGKNLN